MSEHAAIRAEWQPGPVSDRALEAMDDEDVIRYVKQGRASAAPDGGRQAPRPVLAEGQRECRWHGVVDYDHVCVRPGEDADMATARAFGEIRDV